MPMRWASACRPTDSKPTQSLSQGRASARGRSPCRSAAAVASAWSSEPDSVVEHVAVPARVELARRGRRSPPSRSVDDRVLLRVGVEVAHAGRRPRRRSTRAARRRTPRATPPAARGRRSTGPDRRPRRRCRRCEAPALLDLKWLATTVKASPSFTNVCAMRLAGVEPDVLVDQADRVADRLHDVVLVDDRAADDVAVDGVQLVRQRDEAPLVVAGGGVEPVAPGRRARRRRCPGLCPVESVSSISMRVTTSAPSASMAGTILAACCSNSAVAGGAAGVSGPYR